MMNFRVLNQLNQRLALNAVFMAATIGLAGMAWLAISHLASQRESVAQACQLRVELLERADTLHEHLGRLELQRATIAQQLNNFNASMPAHADETGYLHELSARATALHVSLSDFRPGAVRSASHCQEMELKLRCTGQYGNICRWLDSIQAIPRIMHIAQFAVTGPNNPGEDCVVDIQLVLLFDLRPSTVPSVGGSST